MINLARRSGCQDVSVRSARCKRKKAEFLEPIDKKEGDIPSRGQQKGRQERRETACD